jgi:glycine/D-amino acid oxidase-like deaminating enzyme
LKKEFKLLNKYNFPVEYIDAENLKKDFGLNKPNALKTWHDADVNPYKFIQAIAKQNTKNGVKYYENTQLDVKSIKNNKIKTMDGYEINFKYIVLATGYCNIFPIIKDKYEMYRTYAFCSKPIDGFIWKDEVMFWETKNPYIF